MEKHYALKELVDVSSQREELERQAGEAAGRLERARSQLATAKEQLWQLCAPRGAAGGGGAGRRRPSASGWGCCGPVS